ncbi:MAG TPA: DUF6049 family protein [Acidimicrobiales bacterium]
MRNRAVALAAIAVAFTLSVADAPATPSPTVVAQTATGSVTLVAQTAFHRPGQPFELKLRARTSARPDSLEIAVSWYRRLTTRSQFVDSVEGRMPARTPIDLVPFGLETLTADSDGSVAVSVSPALPREGVYPVRVDMREDDGNVVDSFVTHIVSVPATIEADPIDVAIVLPIHAPPAVRPNGEADVDDDRADAIADLAASLAAHPELPLTLQPTAETLEALAASARGAERDAVAALTTAIAGRQVLASTYVPTSLPALLDAGLTGEVAAQLERGHAVIRRLLNVNPTPGARLVDEPLDAPALAALVTQGVDRLVVADAALEPYNAPNRVTPTGRFAVASRDERLSTAVADTGLAAHFTRDVAPALAAAHLLADLSVLWLDRPGTSAERRGVVVLPPRSWVPDTRFVEAVLTGLEASPIHAPVSVDDFFTAVGEVKNRSGAVVRTFRPIDASTRINTGSLRTARRRVEGFASIVAADNPVLARLDRTLLASQSTDLRPRDRAAYITAVGSQVDAQLRAIAMPHDRSITLTARTGELPVTVTNQLGYPIRVVVTLTSDRLEFPGGGERELDLTRENTTERFRVRASSSGSFPVTVRVTAPEGGIVLAESRYTVRSTAVSGVGIALSVGAAAFLVVWWASHLRTRRTEDRAASAPA